VSAATVSGASGPITKRQDDLAPVAPIPADRESSRRASGRVSIKALVGSGPPREGARTEERGRDRGERRPRTPRTSEVREADVSGPTDPVMPGVTIEDDTSERPPPTRRERPRDRDRVSAETSAAPKPAGSVDLFVKLGRRSGQSEPDLRTWLQESGIDMTHVLSVAVRDAHSYVTVPEGAAGELVETLSRHPFADRFVAVELARRR